MGTALLMLLAFVVGYITCSVREYLRSPQHAKLQQAIKETRENALRDRENIK